jgi:hypothetical protein
MMKIFLGYGYNPRDAWVEDLVVRLIHSFGDTALTGKEIQGMQLDEGVRTQISASDALIGFTTRRDPTGSAGTWTTHQWVRDELLTAANAQPQIPFVEVRETQVALDEGMLANRARITYDEAHRDRCLVEIATVIGRWYQQAAASAGFLLEFLPEDFSREILPLLRDPDLRCLYRILREQDIDAGPDIVTPILKLRGRMAIRTRPVPRDAMIQVEVWKGKSALLWTSDWQLVDSRVINLDGSRTS